MTPPLVDILLATYNGQAFLPAQLDSLLAQTYPAWRVLASDDGSTDDTAQILAEYSRRYPERIVIAPNPHPGCGARRNFDHLMQTSSVQGRARYFAFADQDDVWLPHKLALCMDTMQRLEAQAGPQQPCLVHTDLSVVDAAGRLLHPSFARYERLNPAAATRETLLSVNEVTGCTILANRRLLELALPIPDAAIGHDWWCALIAGSGQRLYLPRATVAYRQHSGNQIGARNRSAWSYVRRIMHDAPALWRRLHELGELTWHQALALQQRLIERGLDATYVADYLRWRATPRSKRLLGHARYYAGPWFDRFGRWAFWRSYHTDAGPHRRA